MAKSIPREQQPQWLKQFWPKEFHHLIPEVTRKRQAECAPAIGTASRVLADLAPETPDPEGIRSLGV